MSNIKQFNRKVRNSNHYGPIHSFKVVDVGGGEVMINKGRFYELGIGGVEFDILGAIGNKMVDDLWSTHDPEKAIPVKAGDTIFVVVTFENPRVVFNNKSDLPADGDVGADINLQARVERVGLEIAAAVPAAGDDEKVIPIAKIKAVKDIGGQGVKKTTITQLWKSDIVEIFLAEGVKSSIDVIVSISCFTEEEGPNSGCIQIVPVTRQITYWGELGNEVTGTTLNCCDEEASSSSSSNSGP